MTFLEAVKSLEFKRGNEYGICTNVFITTGHPAVTSVGELLEKHWPHYSGSKDYPIPDPDHIVSAMTKFALTEGSMWDRRTKYGQLRWSALRCLIEFGHRVTYDPVEKAYTYE